MSDRGRLTWWNHARDQSCHPRAIEHPASTEELVRLVQRAESESTTVRAVGAGHAWSDAALTDGYLIETDRMSGLLDLDDGTLRAAAGDDATSVRVRGGTRLHELNRLLEGSGRALANMGGYDAQSIAGVVSTSTHGSGIRFGPFCDAVRSLDLVVAGGRLVRVEPADGPTDPAAFAALHGDGRSLEQDDDVFAAAVCGMGCMGIIDSLVLEVRPSFWLKETRVVRTWEDVRGELAAGVLERHDHWELFLNPYARRGRHEVLVTTRDEVPRPTGGARGDTMRHPLIEMQASVPLVWALLRLAARRAPSLLRTQFGRTLRRMEDDNYTDVSYRVFNIGAANKLPALSMELGVPVEGDTHLRTVDRMLELAADCATLKLFHTSPIALRYVAPSRAYASMMHGRPTMMIELILVAETRNGRALLAEYERNLGADFDARPHWGQFNLLGPQGRRLDELYPKWDRWKETQHRFNASGVFDSEFTDRMGVSISTRSDAVIQEVLARPDPKYFAGVRAGLDAAFARARATGEAPLDPAHDRIVIFSDHHKGIGDTADDFRRCEHAYGAALGHYLDAGYRLLILGDAEELWEEHAAPILARYREVLKLEAQFALRGNGLERIYGNHDDDWTSQARVDRHLGPIFGAITVRESLLLRVERPGREPGRLFFVHGHQGTPDSDRWRAISRPFVRHVWRPIQRRTGFSATTPSRSFSLRAKHDQAMYSWARSQSPGLVMIAGHTHRPVFSRCLPDAPPSRPVGELRERLAKAVADGDTAAAAALRAELEYARAMLRRPNEGIQIAPPCYFNTGCCSFPDGDLTGLEIADGRLRLVRWPANLRELAKSGGGLEVHKRELASEDLESIFEAVVDHA